MTEHIDNHTKPYTFRSLSDFLGGAYAIQWFFAVVSIISFFFALFILPETKGKKLSEIEAYFSGKKADGSKIPKANRNVGGTTVNNRRPKQTLETVTESEKMIKETV